MDTSRRPSEVIVSWQVLIVLAEFAVVCVVIGAGTLVQRVRQRGREQVRH